MELEEEVLQAIQLEAKKLIERYQNYHNTVHLEHDRKSKRITNISPKVIKKPAHWSEDKKFDPFYVLRRSKSIAKSIARKIASSSYSPNPPYTKKIKKKNGGYRTVNIFQIPDAAISSITFKHLLEKNRHRFSSFSYAYRNDRNVHFAIQDISIDLRLSSRTFVAEIDFSDFFGSISHQYLKEQFDKNGFLISKDERHVIEAFLENTGTVGVPQGTSISLFLANLVCWELDKKFEQAGLRFARYADDTVVWSPNYEKICHAFDIVDDFSRKTGVEINSTKSAGIHLLTKPNLPSEMKATTKIDFLGYSLSVKNVSIKDKSVIKIKKEISYILFKNLIQPLQNKPLKALIIPNNNRDAAFLTAIIEIRRYLYGGLNSTQIKNYIYGKTRRIYFKGIMSYYPLLSDLDQLKHLDGWLLSSIKKALKVRGKLLQSHGYNKWRDFPFNASRQTLLTECKNIRIKKKRLLEIPSFTLIHTALTRGISEKGIEKVMNSKSLDYEY